MISQLSEKAVVCLNHNHIINDDETAVYKYGVELILSQTFATIMILGIGFVSGNIVETLVYYFVYASLRIYAGGFHASCYRNCNFIYLTIFFLINYSISRLGKEVLMLPLFMGAIFANLIIVVLAPVADPKKHLEPEEIVRYKHIVRGLLLFIDFMIMHTYLIIPSFHDELLYGLTAICEIAILLIIGYVKNRYY